MVHHFLPLLLGWMVTMSALTLADDDNSFLKVLIPTPLSQYFQNLYPLYGATSGMIKHSQALFGAPKYGGDKKIVGEVFYVTPEANMDGCSLSSEHLPPPSQELRTTIFLVDRGACDFVQKVKLAQDNGASAVLIADNVCQCDALKSWPSKEIPGRTMKEKQLCQKLSEDAVANGRLEKGQVCEFGLPFMADDGFGLDVKIPSFLISFLDAQVLKDCLSTKEGISNFKCSLSQNRVIVSLEWDLPHANTVNYELWSSSDSDGRFKKAFAQLAQKLEDKTVFRPRYFIWNGAQWGCDDYGESCGNQCTPGGRYCNPDPDFNLYRGVSGRDVVEENLRELCVWEQAKQLNKQYLWWTYVSQFAMDCHPGKEINADLFTLQCSELVHRKIPLLSFTKTQQCVATSWNSDDRTRNSKLDLELTDRSNLKIMQLPTVLVNGQVLRGAVVPSTILSGICEGFVVGNAPTICSCVDAMESPTMLEQCLTSSCQPGEVFCSQKRVCYATQAEYDSSCSEVMVPPPLCSTNSRFCESVNLCLRNEEECPICADPTRPIFCVHTQACTSSSLSCRAVVVEIPDMNSASSESIVFTSLVTVCLAGMLGVCYWRKQKTKLHDDVKAILETYRALDSDGEDSNIHVGGARMSGNNGGLGGNKVDAAEDESSAATYI